RRDQIALNPRLAEIAQHGAPALVHPRNYLDHLWRNRVLRVAVELAAATQPGDTIILADEDRFGPIDLPGRTLRPFLESGGAYAGPPRDGRHAIQELTRMTAEGAAYLAIGWPAFWWLDHYAEFADH